MSLNSLLLKLHWASIQSVKDGKRSATLGDWKGNSVATVVAAHARHGNHSNFLEHQAEHLVLIGVC